MVQVSFEALAQCSFTVHPAANSYLVATVGRQRQRGKELATLLPMLMAQDNNPLQQALSYI